MSKLPYVMELKRDLKILLDHYNQGKLQAQAPDRNNSTCTYRDQNGCLCAIGCMFPEYLLDKIKRRNVNNSSIELLVDDNHKLIFFSNSEDFYTYFRLQIYHDQWYGSHAHDRISKENNFKNELLYQCHKLGICLPA